MQLRVSRCPLSASEVEWRGSARSFPDLALRLAPDSRPASVLNEYIGGSWGVDPACVAFHLNMSDDGNEADRITDVSCSGRALSSILLVPGAEELRVTVRLLPAAELLTRAVGGAPRVVRDAASGLDEVEHDEDPMRCWGCGGGITKVAECLEMICGHTHCGDCANAICAAGGEVTCRCAYCGMESMTLHQARGSRQLEQVQRSLLREEEGRGGPRMPVDDDGADDDDGATTTTTATARRAERVSAVREQMEQVLALMAEDTTGAEQREALAQDAVLRRLCECRDALTAMATCAHAFVLGYQPSLLSADSACPSSLRRAVDVALHSTPSLSSLDLEVRAWLLRLVKTDIRSGPRRILRMHAAAHFGECGTIELLHALGADVEAKSVVNSNTTPMHAAAAAGCASAMLSLRRRADVTKGIEEGWTPLHFAAGSGHIDTVLTLHRLGADANACAVGGVTPLISAAFEGHAAVVLLLHHLGAVFDYSSPTSPYAAGFLAASQGHVATLMLLHSLGVDIDDSQYIFDSSAGAAAYRGHLSMIVALAMLGANMTTANETDMSSPIELAAMQGRVETVLLLHALVADVKRLPFSNAARSGHLPLLLALVGLDVDVCGPDALTDALIAAAGNGQTAAVLLLASLGADVNASKDDEVTAVHTACRSGRTATLQMLHTLGAAIDRPNTDALMTAASARSHVATGMLLCQLGADVNARREGTGETALHMAVQRQNVALVCFLHGAGADVNVQAADGATPLFTASRRGDDAIVHLLISSFGADPNKPNSRGMTPIAAAAAEGHVSTVLLLASSGADVNTAALHAAVPKGDIAMVRALCERGADVNQVNAGGDAPLATAAMAAQADAVTVLAQFGADIRAARHDGATALRLVPLSSGRLPLVRPSRQAARTLRVLHGMGAEEW